MYIVEKTVWEQTVEDIYQQSYKDVEKILDEMTNEEYFDWSQEDKEEDKFTKECGS